MGMRKSSILEYLINEQLSAVTFVQTYVQFHFDGPCLSAYVWPTVRNKENTFSKQTPGYRDALCSLIGKLVTDVSDNTNEILLFKFADGATLEVSLRETDQVGPEAAMFTDDLRHIYVVFQ